MVLWNSRYIDAAVTALRTSSYPVTYNDAARLSPLGDKHINLLGRYSFTTLPPGTGLWPLRDPSAPDDERE